MCTIILIPKGVEPDYNLIKQRYLSNSDSWGFSHIKNDNLNVVRGVGGDFGSLRENLSQAVRDRGENGKDIVLHLRTATSGEKKDQGTQPIKVNGTAFFLNGNLKDYFGKRVPDTLLYATEYIAKLPKNFLENAQICEKIQQDAIINNAVMAFMDSKGQTHIMNQERGVWEEGMWFSNPRVGNYAGFGYSGVYQYKNGEKRYNI